VEVGKGTNSISIAVNCCRSCDFSALHQAPYANPSLLVLQSQSDFPTSLSDSPEELERAWVLTSVLAPQITILLLPKLALKMEMYLPNEGT